MPATFAEFYVVMNRMVVAGCKLESGKQRICHCAGRNMECISNLEVFEVFGFKRLMCRGVEWLIAHFALCSFFKNREG